MLANMKKELGLEVGYKSPSELKEEERAKNAGWEGLEKWKADEKERHNAEIDKLLENPPAYPRRGLDF